ncbi:MAG: hypothetical protein EZS28_021643 [Streblomastix strix]|uniref:Uncharacterized protein n=1 Tax=Streblomastix strix TaxID=222440 RepID=A0A5J4VJS1_9EUKA|nr:MAG: hypothetical protein EZS28_021643 [Streblomastix strix]
MSSIVPFTFTFAEYIRHCAMNSKRLREKIFEQEIRNKVIVECFGHQSANVIVHFTDEVRKTYKEEFIREKNIWFRAKINVIGGPGQKHELVAVPMDKNNQPDLTMTFTVFLETYASILDGFDNFPLWKGKKLSFIATVENFEELTEDPYYCAILHVNVYEPLHDNEIEPVKVLIQTSNLHLIPQIKDNPQAAMEFEAVVHERDNNHHFFLLDEILQIMNNKYQTTRRRNPAVPSTFAPPLQNDGINQSPIKGQVDVQDKRWITLRADLYGPNLNQRMIQPNQINIPNQINAYNPYAIQGQPQAQMQYQQMNQQMGQMNVYGTFYPGYAQIPAGILPVIVWNRPKYILNIVIGIYL